MKTSLDPRHQHRQAIVQELFAWAAQEKKNEQLFDQKSQAIASAVTEIDKIIAAVAPEWQLEKINQIDLAILRLAVYELCFEIAEPPKVVIDEAIELAKEFGGENSPAFINGALGKALFTKDRILKIMANKLGVEEEKLTPEANLITDLNATDLEIADLLTILEKDLHIPVLTDQTKIATVGQLLEYVDEHND